MWQKIKNAMLQTIQVLPEKFEYQLKFVLFWQFDKKDDTKKLTSHLKQLLVVTLLIKILSLLKQPTHKLRTF